MKLILLMINLQLIHAFDLDLERLHFIFVHGPTPNNITRYTVANFASILSHPKFNLNKRTALFCHGWFDNIESIGTQAIASAYTMRGDHNFIVFDWGMYDVTLLPIAVQRSAVIAPYVGRALLELFENGLRAYKFHCVGHSIGAHICGAAGREVFYRSGGRVKFQRITALDPAREFFHDPPVLAASLTYLDAHFVDVIHTDGSNRGTPYRLGHVDFYPDGGHFQLSCPPVHFNFITDFCSHWMALFYYANSLTNERAYEANTCDSFEHFKEGYCDDNQINFMGYAASPLAQGVFFLSVDKNEALTDRHYMQALKVILKSILTKSDVSLIFSKKFG